MTDQKEFGDLAAVKKSVSEGSATDKDEQYDADLSTAEAHRSAMDALERRSIEENHKDQVANREMRFKYSRWVYYYLVGYSVFVGILIIFAGFGLFGFSLPESVLAALVGSTAVSAIGLVLAVTTGLFNKRD